MRGGGFENVEKLKNFECGKMGKWSNRLAAIAQLVERLTSTENERRRHQEVSSSNLGGGLQYGRALRAFLSPRPTWLFQAHQKLNRYPILPFARNSFGSPMHPWTGRVPSRY